MKKIDIHKDYLMYELNTNLHRALTLLINYMQDTTPYGEEYENAYRYFKKLLNNLETFEEKLQACVERKNNK